MWGSLSSGSRFSFWIRFTKKVPVPAKGSRISTFSSAKPSAMPSSSLSDQSTERSTKLTSSLGV